MHPGVGRFGLVELVHHHVGAPGNGPAVGIAGVFRQAPLQALQQLRYVHFRMGLGPGFLLVQRGKRPAVVPDLHVDQYCSQGNQQQDRDGGPAPAGLVLAKDIVRSGQIRQEGGLQFRCSLPGTAFLRIHFRQTLPGDGKVLPAHVHADDPARPDDAGQEQKEAEDRQARAGQDKPRHPAEPGGCRSPLSPDSSSRALARCRSSSL